MANTENISFKIMSETEKTQQSFVTSLLLLCRSISTYVGTCVISSVSFMYIIWRNFMIFMYLEFSSWLLDNFFILLAPLFLP